MIDKALASAIVAAIILAGVGGVFAYTNLVEIPQTRMLKELEERQAEMLQETEKIEGLRNASASQVEILAEIERVLNETLANQTSLYEQINALRKEIEALKAPTVYASIAINITNGTVFGPYNITAKNNSTVYDLLLLAAKPEYGNFTVKATYWASFDSMLVESIASKENGQDNKYWQYYVNGALPMVGCDKYIIQNNDYIEWKFEPSPW